MIAEKDWNQFGSDIGGSRWFHGEPMITKRQVTPVRASWLCPTECGGYMVFNGMTWPTGDPGYHHTCDQCGFTAAIHGHRYPEIQYVEADHDAA